MPLLDAGISVTAGLIALTVAGLLHLIGGRAWPRITVVLILAGTVAIVGTPIGQWLRQLMATVDGWLASFLASWTGATVTGLIGLVIVGVLGFDVWKKSISKRTLACAAATPIAGVTIPGTAGAVVMGICTAVASVVGGALSWMFGG